MFTHSRGDTRSGMKKLNDGSARFLKFPCSSQNSWVNRKQRIRPQRGPQHASAMFTCPPALALHLTPLSLSAPTPHFLIRMDFYLHQPLSKSAHEVFWF